MSKKRKYWIQSYFGKQFGWADECPCEDTDTPKDRNDLLALYNFEMPQYLHRLTYHLVNEEEAA